MRSKNSQNHFFSVITQRFIFLLWQAIEYKGEKKGGVAEALSR